MAKRFLVGGSEAPLTAFTIAQMKALKIYAKEASEFPCRAFDLNKTKNTMVLGEAAAVACLEIGEHPNALAYIEGIGYATDDIEHNISISEEANCFQKSMRMALQNTNLETVDAIVMHAPGTLKGDASEVKAIEKIFGTFKPMLTTNKWKVGHTFGASGMLNIEMALFMIQNNQFLAVPYAEKQIIRKNIKKVLINAVGFGGNAVSILVSKS
jgi:3-oxoacyl-(acyl-carrier-protein) synthase